MAERNCLFPGTFDPITLGHTDIINRALPLFDKIYVGIGINAIKTPMYSIQQRIDWLEEIYKDEPKVFCVSYDGLTVEFCKKIDAHFILRGIRYVSDFEYEKTIAHLNHDMLPQLETILIVSRPELSSISSTIVREIIRGKGKIKKFVPKEIVKDLPAWVPKRD